MLAIAIHYSRAKGEKWAVIERYVNEHRQKHGEPALSLGRIKNLPKDYAGEIASYVALRELQAHANSEN